MLNPAKEFSRYSLSETCLMFSLGNRAARNVSNSSSECVTGRPSAKRVYTPPSRQPADGFSAEFSESELRLAVENVAQIVLQSPASRRFSPDEVDANIGGDATYILLEFSISGCDEADKSRRIGWSWR